ncbi:MAG TPA: hypothetical protein VFK33_06475 [Bacillales bacterium]|nr:hypothetical protein [Bacillales bacterium]
MGILAKMKRHHQPRVDMYCDCCGRIIESEEPMAVLAKSPSSSYYGVMGAMINKWVRKTGGTIYCRDCFENQYGYIKVEMNREA